MISTPKPKTPETFNHWSLKALEPQAQNPQYTWPFTWPGRVWYIGLCEGHTDVNSRVLLQGLREIVKETLDYRNLWSPVLQMKKYRILFLKPAQTDRGCWESRVSGFGVEYECRVVAWSQRAYLYSGLRRVKGPQYNAMIRSRVKGSLRLIQPLHAKSGLCSREEVAWLRVPSCGD